MPLTIYPILVLNGNALVMVDLGLKGHWCLLLRHGENRGSEILVIIRWFVEQVSGKLQDASSDVLLRLGNVAFRPVS